VPGEAGIWVLILGEMIIFGIFFVILTRERVSHQALFTQSQHTLNATIGLINTVLLLTSSLFVVSGVHTVRSGRVRNASKFFVLALLCGLGFAVDKIVEYGEMLTAGLTPMTNNFYMYYYVLTGIHAFHLVIGMCVLAFLWWSTRNPTRSPKITLVEGCASYWHMVDVLWIVLFPLLYLT
jgi:nitric oxide reductase NorE protein